MMIKFKQILKNDYSLSVISKIVIAVVGIFSSAFSTRYLGVMYKGDYAYVTHIAGIIVMFLNLGIYQSYSLNYKKLGREIIYKYVNICFLQFAVLFSVMILLMVIVRDPLFCMVVLLVPFNILRMQYGNIVLIENIRLNLWMNVFNAATSALAYLCLYIWAAPNILYAVAVTVVADLITVTVYSIKLGIIPRIGQVDYPFLGSVLKFGFIPMLSSVLTTINYSIDIVFLKKIGLPQELSYYALAASIVNYVWLLPDAFKSVLFSKSAKKFDKESIEFSSQVSSAFIIICLLGFAAIGKWLLTVVYGVEFCNSYCVTVILITGAFSMSLFKLLGVVLVSQGKRMVHFLSLVISAIVNVILNALLIPHMGMYGAGIASVCSYTICGVILLAYFCKLYSMKVHRLLFLTKENIRTIISPAFRSR